MHRRKLRDLKAKTELSNYKQKSVPSNATAYLSLVQSNLNQTTPRSKAESHLRWKRRKLERQLVSFS